MSSVKQSKKSKSVESKVVEQKVVEPKVVEPKANVEKPKEVDNVLVPQTEVSLQESFNGVVSLLVDMNGLLSKVKTKVKVLEKQVSKEMKVLDKIKQKKNKNKGSRAPSGFVKPTKISDELAGFLKKDDVWSQAFVCFDKSLAERRAKRNLNGMASNIMPANH